MERPSSTTEDLVDWGDAAWGGTAGEDDVDVTTGPLEDDGDAGSGGGGTPWLLTNTTSSSIPTASKNWRETRTQPSDTEMERHAESHRHSDRHRDTATHRDTETKEYVECVSVSVTKKQTKRKQAGENAKTISCKAERQDETRRDKKRRDVKSGTGFKRIHKTTDKRREQRQKACAYPISSLLQVQLPTHTHTHTQPQRRRQPHN